MPAPKFADIEGVDASPAKAPRFDDIEAAPSDSPSILSSLKDMVVPSKADFEAPSRMKVPRREDYPSDENFRKAIELYSDPERQKREAKGGLQTRELNDTSRVLSFMGGADVTGLGGKAASLVVPEAQKTLEEERRRNPKTNLAGGLTAPFGSTAKQLIPVAFGVGALNAAAHGENPLVGGGVNAAAAALTHGAFKGAGAVASKLFGNSGETLASQMAATLGPEGPAFAADLERMAGRAAEGTGVGAPFSEPFTGRVEMPTAPGSKAPLPEVTKSSVRPIRDVTELTPRAERETNTSFRPGRGEYTKPGARAARAEQLAESPDTAIIEAPEGTRSGKAPAAGEVTRAGRPPISPSEALLRRAERAPEGTLRPEEPSTYVGPATAAERESAMYDAGKTRKIIPHTPESIEAAASEIEKLAKERGLRPVDQGIENGQYPGDPEVVPKENVVEVGARPKVSGEPTFIDKELLGGRGTVAQRAPVNGRPEFQKAMDFLTGEDELGKTATKYVPRDSLLPKGQQSPEMTYVASKRLNPEVGGGSGKGPDAIGDEFLSAPNEPITDARMRLYQKELRLAFKAHVKPGGGVSADYKLAFQKGLNPFDDGPNAARTEFYKQLLGEQSLLPWRGVVADELLRDTAIGLKAGHLTWKEARFRLLHAATGLPGVDLLGGFPFKGSARLEGRYGTPSVGGGSGDFSVNPASHPKPGPPFEAGPLQPTDVPDSFAVHAAEAEKALKQDKSVWETIRKGLSLPENRAEDEVAAAIRSFRGARAMREVGLKMHEKLNATLKELPPVDRARVQKIITGLRDRKLGREAVDQLPPEFRNLFQSMEREKQEMLVSLVREGYYTPQQMVAMKHVLDEGQVHLHRSYQAFLAKKGYDPGAGAIAEAAKFIAKEKGLPEYEAVQQVTAQMKRMMQEGVNSEGGLAAAMRDAGLMKGRTLPPQLRKLLGVIDDPAFIVADSMGELAQQYHLARVTNAFADPAYRGKVWAEKPAPGFDPRRLWDETKSLAENKQMFGELAGKYVKPELYEAMANAQAPAAQTLGSQVMNAAVGWFALAKVTASPVTWLRNLLSNTYNLTVSGVPAYHYLNPKVVQRALAALKSAGSRTSMKEAGTGEWARMALEDWAIPEGRGTDWGGSEAQRIINEAVRGSPGGLVGVFDKVFRLYNKGRGKLGTAYEFADQLPRLIGYMYHVEQGVKMGMPEMAARARASQLVNRYFATGASVGPLLRGLASKGGSPFSSWFVDNMRVAKNIGQDAVRGDFGSLARSSLFMGGVAGAFMGLRQLGGFTDTDIAAGNRALKGSWDDNNAFHDWLPFRDKKGNMYAVSFDGLNPMATFLKGPPGSPAKNVAANIVKGMTQSGLLQMPADALLAQAGVRPEEYRPPVLPGQEGQALANSVWSYMQPTLVRQFRDVVRKAQLAPDMYPLREGEEPQGLGESLLTTFNPLSVEKVGPHTAEAKRRQEQGAVGQLKDARKAVKRSEASTQTSVRDEANRRLEELRQRQSK